MKRSDITPQLLQVLLRYEPETGKLFWRHRSADYFPDKTEREILAWNKLYAGKEALASISNNGAKSGFVLNNSMKASRVAWAVHYGAWPSGYIDHIDGDRTNNSLANLRDVSHRENSRNTALYRNNSSGTLGVYFYKPHKKWLARIYTEKGRITIGRFDTVEEASAARRLAEIEHGYHPNHGMRLVPDYRQKKLEASK